MSQPVVHFEIIGTDPARLRSFFGELFGWRYERTPVAVAVSEPDNYGFIELLTASDGSGIRGGVGGGSGYDSRALFYVGVPDVERALERAESLGGERTMGPETSPTGLVVGQFTDPAGNLIGLASAG
jgi:predicted enzyme related to lactoylglutathione lyase